MLSGVDLAYTGKKRYAEGVGNEDEVLFSLLDAEKSAADRILKKKDRRGQPVYTAVRWVMETSPPEEKWGRFLDLAIKYKLTMS